MSQPSLQVGGWARRLIIGLPLLWLLSFFLLPFLIVFKISFAEALIAVPPYSALFDVVDGVPRLKVDLYNYEFLFSDSLYALAYLNSLKIAFFSTLVCLAVGYPLAWAIAHARPETRGLWLTLVILPSWTSFLIRVYAWIGILKSNGLVNNLLLTTGVIDEPLRLLRTDLAVYIGIVYTYLPFMVLPLYANIVKLDRSLVEAAQDLGARPLSVFRTVIVPLTRTGIVTGCMLVFIPVVGEFVIPELLGGPDTLMIGKVLWQEFFNNRNWPIASAVAVLMMLLLIVPIAVFYRNQSRELEAGS